MERLISLSLARRSIEYARRAVWRRTVFAKFLSNLGARIDPKSQDVSMHEESSCLVKREFYPINCGGRRDCFALVAAEKLGKASICQRRHGGRHLGAVQRPRCHGGARRGAPCAPPRWVASVRRTRTVARCLSGLVAGPSHPAVEALFGRLSSESADRRPAAIGRVQACPTEDRLCAGAAADDVHV